MKKICLMAAAVSAILLFSACSLLPVEEEAPVPPLIKEYERAEYKYTEVARGDVVSTVKAVGRYYPTKKENLAFSESGAAIEAVYVTAGDYVKQGDILAALDVSDINSQINETEYEIALLKNERTYLTESFLIKKERYEYEISLLSDVEDMSKYEALSKAEEEYALSKQVIDIQIESLEEKCTALREKADSGVIHAGIDGTVTYVLDYDASFRSSAGDTVVSIADSTSSVFVISGKDSENFNGGDEVSLNISGSEYPGRMVTAQELGIEEVENTAYAVLDEPLAELKDNTSASISRVVETHENVIYVLSKAVKTATNGESFVYVPDEDGIRTLRNVEVGLTANGRAEIISGLSEGEMVIVS